MSFIPALHFRPAADKLKSEFCNEAINFYYYNTNLVSLLEGKNILEIEQYTAGNFDMSPFKRMFKSLENERVRMRDPNITVADRLKLDKTGIHWSPVGLIPSKINAAAAIIQKQPFDITAKCTDPLAQKHKQADIDFLVNKSKMEATLQPLYDSMNLGKVDMGATEHSDIAFTGLPLDLDIDDPNQLKIFADIIYNLAPESAIEVILEEYKDIKKLEQVKYMEILDHYKFGVSCNRCIDDKITELPNLRYVYPDTLRTEPSRLPDYSDGVFRVIDEVVTPMELFNEFPDEISSEAFLREIVNGPGNDSFGASGQVGPESYCGCNNVGYQPYTNFDTFKMQLKYCELKTIDYALVSQRKNSRFKSPTDDPKKATGKIWGQNTICFYWLYKTKYFFGIDRLPYAYRTKGKEIYTPFSTSICRSQQTSAVELSIGENKKAQIADIKLQYELIMAVPDGYAVNIAAIRKAVDSLIKEEGAEEYTVAKIMEAGREKNIWVYEQEGYEGTRSQPQVPVTKILGGLSSNFLNYYRVRAEAEQAIARYTGINDQLTGQTPSPDMLIGLQKLLVNASINALHYVPVALLAQYRNVFSIWGNYIQKAIKDGGPARDAIEQVIGSRKLQLLKGLNAVPLHQIGIKIDLGQRVEEREAFKAELLEKHKEGILDALDVWMIENTPNPKDAMLLIAIKESKFAKKQEDRHAADLANQQQIAKQQGDNMVQNTQAQTQGKIQVVQAQGSVDDQLQKSAAQLGMNAAQVEGLIKLKLQKDRSDSQIDKSLKTLGAKSNLDNQNPFGS